MATNPPGKGKAIIACSVPAALAKVIIARGKMLGWTKSKYAGLLLQRWYEAGCPPVADNEIFLLGREPFDSAVFPPAESGVERWKAAEDPSTESPLAAADKSSKDFNPAAVAHEVLLEKAGPGTVPRAGSTNLPASK